MIKTAKFGGSSLANGTQFKKVKNIIQSDNSRKFIVVSAPGKSSTEPNKITDLLYLTNAHLKYGISHKEIFEKIKDRFKSIVEECSIDFDLEGEFRLMESKFTKNVLPDYVVSRGEYLTAKILATYVGYDFLDPADHIHMDYNGKILLNSTLISLKAALSDGRNYVIPGFYGSTSPGRLKLLSRGGSDITGAVVASATGSDLYENWTDVSGILMADPRIVNDPEKIEYITYDELKEMSYMGAEVLHEESIFPVREASIPINIKNTNSPEDPGTIIVEKIPVGKQNGVKFITGITGKKNYTVLTVYNSQLSSDVSTIKDILDVYDKFGITFDHVQIGINNISILINDPDVLLRINEVKDELTKSNDPDSISVVENISLISLVGRNMVMKPGISGKIFKALGDEAINIRMITQGPNEINILVGVEDNSFEDAIRTLYSSFTKSN
ncbi:MAG: aspartate kinase [Clostridiaceae bacterium]